MPATFGGHRVSEDDDTELPRFTTSEGHAAPMPTTLRGHPVPTTSGDHQGHLWEHAYRYWRPSSARPGWTEFWTQRGAIRQLEVPIMEWDIHSKKLHGRKGKTWVLKSIDWSWEASKVYEKWECVKADRTTPSVPSDGPPKRARVSTPTDPEADLTTPSYQEDTHT